MTIKATTNQTRRDEVESCFTADNLDGEPREIRSHSGRYRLVIRSYRTRPGCWNYTRGTILRISDGAEICDIKRNYSVFHHSFIEKDGREFLITGRSYMSQTIVDLDRGIEYEPSGDHYYGGAFCWARCYASPDGNTLAVDGCVWAAPYEFRFFDFTDPTRGWPPLRLIGADGVEDPSDHCAPAWLDARRFECHQADHEREPQERTRLERRGDEMCVVEHWVSEDEQARRARAQAEWDAQEDVSDG